MLSRILAPKPTVPEIDVAAAERARASGAAQLVDVRERDEWDAGHLPGAVLIPLGELALRTGELAADRPVIMICHSGARSGYATDFLLKSGFKDVKNMTGGMLAWAQARYPIER